jgi:hypothetical protein
LALGRRRVGRSGVVALRVTCPPRGATGRCTGRARLDGARKRFTYDLASGESRVLRFALSRRRLRDLRGSGSLTLGAVALDTAPGGSTITQAAFTVSP